MDLRALLFGAFSDHWILLVQPFPNRCGRLFVSLLQRLLRRVSPALQVLTNGSNLQPQSVTGCDQLTDCLTRPQGIAHLQLVRRPVLDQHLHLGLFRLAQQTPSPRGTSSTGNRCRLPSAACMRLTGSNDRIPTQLPLRNCFPDRRPRKTPFYRPPPPLV